MIIGFLLQLFISLILPFYYLYTLLRTPYTSSTLKYLTIIYTGLFMLALYLFARWDMTNYYLRYFWLGAFFLSTAILLFRPLATTNKAETRKNHFQIIVAVIYVIGLLAANIYILLASIPPNNAVNLASPLRDGTSYVAHGGNSPIINYHNQSRSQRYALDIGEINQFGYQASLASDLKAYQIFGRAIYSPCDGKVHSVVNNLPDLTPPNVDKKNLAGNHVIIQCKEITLMLAHMKQNSVVVKKGQQVSVNTKLGEVGNSGNSTQPHLHMHAVDISESPFKGTGVPLLIDGKFLVRNALF